MKIQAVPERERNVRPQATRDYQYKHTTCIEMISPYACIHAHRHMPADKNKGEKKIGNYRQLPDKKNAHRFINGTKGQGLQGMRQFPVHWRDMQEQTVSHNKQDKKKLGFGFQQSLVSKHTTRNTQCLSR